MFSSNCPSCGAPVHFKSELSTHLTCSSCQSVVLRRDVNVELIGEVAELQADYTVLQIGSLVTYQEQNFEVIGRLQLIHSTGFWNEWHLIDQQGESWWLGEAMGQFFLSQKKAELSLPSWEMEALKPGHNFTHEQTEVKTVITNVGTATVSGSEGELPFYLPPRFEYTYYDLRSTTRLGYSLEVRDQEDSSSTLYEGQWLDFTELAFQNTKDPYTPPEGSPNTLDYRSISKLNCTQCGAPFELHLGNSSRSYCCPYCESLYDTSSPELKLLSQAQERKEIDTPLEIGDHFDYQDSTWRLTGILCKEVIFEGTSYPWKEYLLFNPHRGYRWLSCSNNHWTWFEPMLTLPASDKGSSAPPVGRPESEFKSTNYHFDNKGPFLHFDSSKPTVTRVLGEFYWRVKKGDTNFNHDYIAPPQMLSCEESLDELFWSAGNYLPLEDLQKQFPDKDFPQPIPKTIPAPCQPNPHQEEKARAPKLLTHFLFILCVLALYQFFCDKKIHEYSHTLSPKQAPINQIQEFDFPEPASMNFTFKVDNLLREYCNTKAVLIHQPTQKRYDFEVLVDKESTSQTFYLRGMPKGRYSLIWNTRYDNFEGKFSLTGIVEESFLKDSDPQPTLTIQIDSSIFSSEIFLLLLFLILFLGITGATSDFYNFEENRWRGSSHYTDQTQATGMTFSCLGSALTFLALAIHGFYLIGYLSSNLNINGLTWFVLCLSWLALLFFLGSLSSQRTRLESLIMPLLFLFAINSFFGYGFSSAYTRGKSVGKNLPILAVPVVSQPVSSSSDSGRSGRGGWSSK